jgi:DMSO/TMAO reductase YedYZ molybdopterin-dependent catalytic subunit
MQLPPGQHAIATLPRFGLAKFAERLPRDIDAIAFDVAGDVANPLRVGEELGALPRVEHVSDFHCVTTWSVRSLRWSGVRFVDFHERIVVPRAQPLPDASFVVLCCRDGYRVSLPLADLLAADVLLADSLDGAPLPLAHGAPIRLVAPAHYGYKNAKHLCRIEYWRDASRYRPAAFRFMDHPRARVALEERGRGVPGWLLRYVYRPLIAPTIRRFRRALERRATEVSMNRDEVRKPWFPGNL